MARGLKAVDLSTHPELMKLAEEVEATGKAQVLRKNNRDIAMVIPVETSSQGRRSKKRSLSPTARAAFLSSAGGWNDIDTERLLDDIYRARQVDDRLPPDL